MSGIEQNANNLNTETSQAELVMTEARLNVEMILEAQADERQRIEERHVKEMQETRKHYGRIILCLVLTLILLVGSALGGVIYVLMNYDIGIITQDSFIGGNGDLNIYDGIHYSDD